MHSAFPTLHRRLLTLAWALGMTQAVHASEPPARTYVSGIPALLEHSPAEDWEPIPSHNLVLMQMHGRQLVVELTDLGAPANTQRWRELISLGYFQHSSVQRVHDNYVVQWGQAQAQPLPAPAHHAVPKETRFELDAATAARFIALDARDSYSANVGFIDSFPVGVDTDRTQAWLLHCHGSVGTVQAEPAITGAVYFYASIGNPTRELDGKLAIVGRVVEGIDALSSLPRGEGVYGFLDEPQHVALLDTTLASQRPAQAQPRLERLRSTSPTFAKLLELRAGSLTPAPGSNTYPLDVCSVAIPVRRQPVEAGTAQTP